MTEQRVRDLRRVTCEKCIAKEYGETVDSLRDVVEEFFGVKLCMGI